MCCTTRWFISETAEAARQAAEKMLPCVIKAQVHSGGRGKAGGVKLAKTADEAETIARQMLGMQLVTKQTGPAGKTVHKVLITEAVAVKKEYYLSVTGDMNRAGLVIVASSAGGTEIEETAKTAPEAIVQVREAWGRLSIMTISLLQELSMEITSCS